jgi:hypothetical protein
MVSLAQSIQAAVAVEVVVEIPTATREGLVALELLF